MLTTFSTKSDTIFLDVQSKEFNYNIDTTKKVNIILSPSLYWVKKVTLPVKYVKDAKKLLPSLFEDTLPEGNYSYTAYKSADDFFIFAYEDRVILDTIAQKGIASSKIANIYFAQSELSEIKGAVKVNETQSIYVKDDMVILLPCCWIEESGELDLENTTLSKHKVVLQQFGHIVDSSSLYKIAAVLVFLIVLVATEFFITLQKTAEVSELKNELFTKYNLKSTMMQNKSMLKNYKNIHDKQNKIREYTSYILGLRLKNSEKLSNLDLKDKTLTASFSGIKKGSESHITKLLKSKKVKFKTSFSKDSLKVEIEL